MKKGKVSVETTEGAIEEKQLVYVKSALLKGEMIPRRVHSISKELGKTIIMLSRFSHDSFSPEELIPSKERAKEIALRALEEERDKISRKIIIIEENYCFV